MIEKLDVIFRADREAGQTHITAVFPSEPSDIAGHFMSCYSHVGQHGGCSFDWYRGTRPAKLDEYADLLAELCQIYAPECELVVKQRITPQHRAAREKQARTV